MSLFACASALVLGACEQRLPNQPDRPIDLLADLLSTTTGATGTTFRATGTAVIEFKDSTGRWSRQTPAPWAIAATMRSTGIATLDLPDSPDAPTVSATSTDLQFFLQYLAPVVAVAGDARSSPFYTGFSQSATDSTGAVVEIRAVAATDGRPIGEIQVRRKGVLVSKVKLTWTAKAGGYILTRQVASLYRGSGAELFAEMAASVAYSSISPAGLAARLARQMRHYALAAMLPLPLYAQSCAKGILDTALGFTTLVVTAPATSSGVGAYLWLVGWVKWTETLIDTVDACDK